MSVNVRDADTGELVTLASGTRMWVGTKAAHTAAVNAGTMPNNVMVCLTDDYVSDEEVYLEDNSTDGGDTYSTGWVTRRTLTLSSGIWVVNAFWDDSFNTGSSRNQHRILNVSENKTIVKSELSPVHYDDISTISGGHYAGTLSCIVSLLVDTTIGFQNIASVGGGGSTNKLTAVKIR